MSKNRIDGTFKELKIAHRKALIGYITAGFPTKASLLTLVPLLEKAGLDLLEIGIPFSDPIADGPTIQHSSHIALENGVTLKWVLGSVLQLRKKGVQLPIIFMSYSNPILAMGIEGFFKAAHEAGVDGLIIPDMIPEEAEKYARFAEKHGVDLIFLVAPTTPKARMRMIAQKTRGFLYAVSLTGVTGIRQALPAHVAHFLRDVKAMCSKPVAVGFGVSTPEQARDISVAVDGVVVGSALVREIEKSKGSAFRGAAQFVSSLARALNPQKDNHHAS